MVSSKAVPCSESVRRMAPPWASSMARTIASPIPVPPLSRRVVKKLSKICVRLLAETPSPLSLTLRRSRFACRIADISSAELLWRIALSARLEKMMLAFSSDIRIGVSRSPLARISSAGNAERKLAIKADGFAAPSAKGTLVFRRPGGGGDDVVEKFPPVLVVHRRRLDVVAQQLGGALDRRQR